jgi:hypothetical protein
MENAMKKALVAVVTVAALGAGTISNAQAQDEVVPFIAGAVVGTVIGVVIAKRDLEILDPPLAEEPPPRVVFVERPVVVKRGPPVHVHHPRPYKRWDWRHDDRRRDWH